MQIFTKSKVLFVLGVLVVAALGAIILVRPVKPAPSAGAANITIDDNVFEPAEISIKRGTKVTWTVSGDDDDAYVIASNPHPSHTGLPGLASRSIRAGEKYTYVFDKVGTFGYHNELIPTGNGTIKVVE